MRNSLDYQGTSGLDESKVTIATMDRGVVDHLEGRDRVTVAS